MVSASNVALPLWAAVFGTLYQVGILVFGIFKFRDFLSFCTGANNSGQFPFVKTTLVYTMYSYIGLTIISISFMWVSYAKAWAVGILFVLLPMLSILFFVLVTFGTVNDISLSIDNGRRGRKRLPIQPPPQLVVVPVDAAHNNNTLVVVNTPQKQTSPRNQQTPVLPLQQR